MQLNQLLGADFSIKDEDLKGFEKLPKALYRLYVNSFKVEDLPEHGIVKLVFECIVSEGEYQNRKVFLDFPTSHPNPQVIEIAIQNLKKFFVACGKRSAVSCEEAVGAIPVVEITYQKDKKDPSKEYSRYNFLTPQGQPLAYLSTSSTPKVESENNQSADDTPPWMRN